MKRLIFFLSFIMFTASVAQAQQGNFVTKSGSSNITDSPALILSPLTFANFTFATTSANDFVFGTFTPFNINFQAVTKKEPWEIKQ